MSCYCVAEGLSLWRDCSSLVNILRPKINANTAPVQLYMTIGEENDALVAASRHSSSPTAVAMTRTENVTYAARRCRAGTMAEADRIAAAAANINSLGE